MDLKDFQFTSGTTAGRHHRTAPNLLNNQDTVLTDGTSELITGVLSDGCGQMPHSDYGAKLTVATLDRLIWGRFDAGRPFTDEWFTQLYENLVNTLCKEAKEKFRASLSKVLSEYMMATAGGVIIGVDETIFFGGGDFLYGVNGEISKWHPEEGNAPLYPAKSLFFLKNPTERAKYRFHLHRVPTADINTVLMTTDGGEDWHKALSDSDTCFPGTDKPVGTPKDFWANDSFYAPDRFNPDPMGIWLNRMAQNYRMPGPPHQGGLLGDDTTIFAARRNKPEETEDA